MARTNASLILKADGSTPQVLGEKMGGILDNFAARSLSDIAKNQKGSVDPKTGSVEYDRMLFSEVIDYSANPSANRMEKVTVNIGTEKKLQELVKDWEMEQYGVDGIIDRKSQNYAVGLQVFMDKLFFTTAESVGTEVTVAGTDAIADVLLVGRTLTDMVSDYAEGIDAGYVSIFLNSDTFDALVGERELLPNTNANGIESVNFRGFNVYRNARQTKDIIAMVNGSIALPIMPVGTEVEKKPGTREYFVSLFFKYGIKALMPEMVLWADRGTPSV